MEDREIIRQASNFVFSLFKEKLSKKLVYHNYKHTFETVKETRSLAQAHNLPEQEQELLILAAWLHDTGYTETYNGHEERSVEIATTFLREHGYPEEYITVIAGLIQATRHGAPTHSLLEDILVDADMSNIGKSTFFSTGELLRVEWEIFLNKFFTDIEWAQYQLDFLLNTNFKTHIAQQKFAEQLGQNIQEQRQLLSEVARKQKKKEKKKQETLAQPKRGIETMFQSTYSNHISLSSIADNKANMMISLNTLIMSIIITYLGTRGTANPSEFSENRSLLIPIGLLLLTTLSSVIISIISANPEVTSFSFKRNKITSRKVNLLFFGNFTNLTLNEFQNGMHDIMRDKNSLYNNMVTDIYYLGEVLKRKYRLLQVSYTVFMIGLILTVVSFMVIYIMKL